MIIRSVSYPRAALIGNPSDGYFGKTIAFLFKNFRAEILLYETPELEILPSESDSAVFDNIDSLVEDVKFFGYYGGIRLLKAAIKKFADYCEENDIPREKKNFTIRYDSDIPFRLGLAGSSAIITASIRAMMEFYQISIPPEKLANLVLSVELDELQISAGLQDRVAQAFECPVFMNFDEKLLKTRGYGIYEPIELENFPDFYIAYRTELSEGSEVVHNNFRERYRLRDPSVLEAVEQWKDLSDEFYERLKNKQFSDLGALIDRNFDIRKRVMRISQENLDMVKTARKTGASAKFTGSGGAIIGTYSGEIMFNELKARLNSINVEVIKPEIVFNKSQKND